MGDSLFGVDGEVTVRVLQSSSWWWVPGEPVRVTFWDESGRDEDYDVLGPSDSSFGESRSSGPAS